MFGKIMSLFKKESVDFKALKDDGAIILDVRTPSEFNNGHISGAKNIPVQNLASQLNQIKKDKTYITCCASGVRSGKAKAILTQNGYIAYNGGGWSSLQQKIQ